MLNAPLTDESNCLIKFSNSSQFINTCSVINTVEFSSFIGINTEKVAWLSPSAILIVKMSFLKLAEPTKLDSTCRFSSWLLLIASVRGILTWVVSNDSPSATVIVRVSGC